MCWISKIHTDHLPVCVFRLTPGSRTGVIVRLLQRPRSLLPVSLELFSSMRSMSNDQTSLTGTPSKPGDRGQLHFICVLIHLAHLLQLSSAADKSSPGDTRCKIKTKPSLWTVSQINELCDCRAVISILSPFAWTNSARQYKQTNLF